MKKKKIAIIGCGNLGLSILNGLLSEGTVNPKHITVTKRNTSSLAHLSESGITITSDNILAIKRSEIIIIALKPYKILELLKEFKPHLKADKHIVVSLASGISIQQIRSNISSKVSIYRAMPNTAANVGISMTCICTTSNDTREIESVKDCFNTIGESIIISEELMDSATVLGACGIAYVLRFMRAMIQGGIQIGFNVNIATQIVTQTVKGASELLIQNGNHPEFEIDKVTTPKGCTIEGLNEMEHNGFSSALIKGISKSYEQIQGS